MLTKKEKQRIEEINADDARMTRYINGERELIFYYSKKVQKLKEPFGLGILFNKKLIEEYERAIAKRTEHINNFVASKIKLITEKTEILIKELEVSGKRVKKK